MIVYKRSVCPQHDCTDTSGLLTGVEGGPSTLMMHPDDARERGIAEDMESFAGRKLEMSLPGVGFSVERGWSLSRSANY